MLNPLFFAWVKNVYSLRATACISSAQTSTHHYAYPTFPHAPVQNRLVVLPVAHSFTPYISTSKNRVFNLLTAWLYPQSTTPTMKTKKER